MGRPKIVLNRIEKLQASHYAKIMRKGDIDGYLFEYKRGQQNLQARLKRIKRITVFWKYVKQLVMAKKNDGCD